MSTVKYLRRLPPYPLTKRGSPEDPYVRDILNSCLDTETLRSLEDYTRGMYTPELHIKSFMQYDRPLVVDKQYGDAIKSHPSFQRAIDRIRSDFAELRGTPIMTFDDIDQVEWVPSSVAGLNYVGLKRDNYAKAKINAARALKDYRLYRNKYKFVPDMAFARSQLALIANPKIRHVWGRAFHHILIEGLVAQPLIKRLLKHETPIYIGRDLHKDMPYTVNRLLHEGWFAHCLDFSKFDASACSFLIETAWMIIQELLVFNSFDDFIVFQFCRDLFTRTPVVMPSGRLFAVSSGVPSGSYFTQLVDSIVNMILIYMLIDTYGCLSCTEIKVLGDDSIFCTPVPIVTTEIASQFFAPFGMSVSDKTVITDNYHLIIFLGHHFYGSRVTRSDFTCLSLALHTEEPTDDIKMTILRLASLIYDSGFNSFVIQRILKILQTEHRIDWTDEQIRPVDVSPPFFNLFMLG